MTKTESSSKKTSLFNGYELILGKQEDVRQWKAFILKLNTLKGTELSRYLMQRLNIDNYLRWLTGAVCTVNYDGFDQNYAVYLPQSERKKLTSRLLAYSVFRKRYKSLIGAMVMKHFTVAKLDRDLQRMFKRIAPYIYIMIPCENGAQRYSKENRSSSSPMFENGARSSRKL